MKQSLGESTLPLWGSPRGTNIWKLTADLSLPEALSPPLKGNGVSNQCPLEAQMSNIDMGCDHRLRHYSEQALTKLGLHISRERKQAV